MSNKYTYTVPFTEDELYNCYVIRGMSQNEIALKFSTTQRVVWRAMRKMGIEARIAAKRNQMGSANSNWVGGRVLMATTAGPTRFSDAGYWYIRKPDHPNAKKNGYIAEHVVVATEAAGRPLQPGENVHHKDLNKHNNDAYNLVICTKKRHREYHLQLEHIAVELYRKGFIGFDADKGYFLKQETVCGS